LENGNADIIRKNISYVCIGHNGGPSF